MQSADRVSSVANTLALLPTMGFVGRNGPTGEYDSMCAEQLFNDGLLEKLA